MSFLIDSYAWIEYLNGSKLGEFVDNILKKREDIYTLGICVSEVVSKVKREKQNADLAYNAIISNSRVVDVTSEIAKEAGLFHAEIKQKIKNFGIVDAIIYVSARKLGAKVLTGDEHFRGLKEAVIIK